MSSVAASDNVSSWGERNLVQLNSMKIEVCALNTKKNPFIVSPVFQNTPLKGTPSISILGLNVSIDYSRQYRDHLDSKAKLASNKLGVINRARRYFTAKHRNIGPRFGLILSTVLISGLVHPIISLNHLIAYDVEPLVYNNTFNKICVSGRTSQLIDVIVYKKNSFLGTI